MDFEVGKYYEHDERIFKVISLDSPFRTGAICVKEAGKSDESCRQIQYCLEAGRCNCIRENRCGVYSHCFTPQSDQVYTPVPKLKGMFAIGE